jgi:hypothetical protein
MNNQFNITSTHLLLVVFVLVLFYLASNCNKPQKEKINEAFNNRIIELNQSEMIDKIKNVLDTIIQY